MAFWLYFLSKLRPDVLSYVFDHAYRLGKSHGQGSLPVFIETLEMLIMRDLEIWVNFSFVYKVERIVDSEFNGENQEVSV